MVVLIPLHFFKTVFKFPFDSFRFPLPLKTSGTIIYKPQQFLRTGGGPFAPQRQVTCKEYANNPALS